ncbi:NADH:ubiquinone oxidoreductase subunit C [Elusimicrobium posterum]
MLKQTREDALKELLETKFNGLLTDVQVRRERRVWCKVEGKNIYEVTKILMNTLNFDYLCTITGLDCGETINAIYHWGEAGSGVMVNIEAVIPTSDLKIPSITPLYRARFIMSVNWWICLAYR